ncbi:MAG: hypothetical protein QOD75_893 [Blastocatellia bacterium]|jgi:hypothetical protein|nr:hypothetical protein [Blastocatellia bacterium]
MIKRRESSGSLVAAVLAGSWRAQPPQLDLTLSEFNEVTPLLYESGAAALGWQRIQSTEFSQSPSGDLLHQAYRLQLLQSSINETKIRKVFRLLRGVGIEPILFKGWSVARLYPQRGLRPYGDIDILVHPKDYAAAKLKLSEPENRDCWVDLHQRLLELDDRKLEDLFTRSQLVEVGQAFLPVPTEGNQLIRVLGLEDHSALLAIHLLKHGAWRPLWLCDLAVILDALPETFDWDLCLGQKRLRVNWITTALGLAQSLLDAQIKQPALAAQARQVPDWLVANVLKQWEAPSNMLQEPMNHAAPMAAYLRRPRGVLRDLRNRWPNPILATVAVKGRFNRLPRLPYQIGNCLLRVTRFAAGLGRGELTQLG